MEARLRVAVTIQSNTRTTLSGDYSLEAVDKLLRFRPAGYQWSPAFKRGIWDGYVRLFSAGSEMFPTGCLPLVLNYFVKKKIEYTLTDNRNCPLKWDGNVVKTLGDGDGHITLRPDQRAVVRKALQAGRGVVKSATGSGKTEDMAATIASLGGPKTLVVVPNLNLVGETADRLERRLGYKVGRIGGGSWDIKQVTVAIPSSLLSKKRAGAAAKLIGTTQLLMVDECFPAGVMVGGKPIQDIKVGDVVPAYDSASGAVVKRSVTNTFKSRPACMVSVNTPVGTISCTAGHPFMTSAGWRKAGELSSGDMVLYTTQHENYKNDLCSVPLTCDPEWGKEAKLEALGESVLLRRLPGCVGASVSVAPDVKDKPKVRLVQDAYQESDVRRLRKGKGSCVSSLVGVAASSTLWERLWSYCSAAVAGLRSRLGNGGVRTHTSTARQRLPDLLQVGYWKSVASNWCRGRRGVTLQSQGAGQEEGRSLTWVRVDSVKVLEPGCDRTFGGVCPDGFVYNIEVEEVHTYLANNFVVHNCHHTAATTWYKVLSACSNAYYRFGFSGTPLDRDDGANLRLIALTGPVIANVRSATLVKQGVLARPYVKIVEIAEPKIPSCLRYDEVYKLGIVKNKLFHDKVAEIVNAELAAGRTTLVLVTQLAHGHYLAQRLPGAKFVHAKLDKEEIKEAKAELADGRAKVLIASPVFREGMDVPAVDTLVMADGGKSVIRVIQKAGRAMRRKTDKPNICRIVDFAHLTHPYLSKHALRRIEVYRREGFTFLKEE